MDKRREVVEQEIRVLFLDYIFKPRVPYSTNEEIKHTAEIILEALDKLEKEKVCKHINKHSCMCKTICSDCGEELPKEEPEEIEELTYSPTDFTQIVLMSQKINELIKAINEMRSK